MALGFWAGDPERWYYQSLREHHTHFRDPLGQGGVGEDILGFRLVEWEGSVVTVMEMCSR